MNATAQELFTNGVPSGAFPLQAPIRMRRFFPDNGVEIPSVTEYQMREIERIGAEETGPDLLYMIERAGLSLALLAAELLGPGARKARIVVLAGRGAGGETGICAARHLAEQRHSVQLCLSNPPFVGQPLSYQHRLYASMGGQDLEIWNLREQACDLIVDALMDYRSGAVPRGNTAGLIRWANEAGAPILSLDIPSGIQPTTGRCSTDSIGARWTLAAGLPKSGLTPETAGEMFVADIGLREETCRRAGISYISPFENRLWVPVTCVTDPLRLDW